MKLFVTTETLDQLLHPEKRNPADEQARRETLRAARELGKTLVIRTPAQPLAPAHD
ncbi:hypothetical protein [Deinococcus sp.]|uniref:hypothetical protein n=1 Tax=Deinococcus sp. TaxID=47478 RepID=UPI0025E95885|nr:hypothetical protein [Deinococcus sp.]